MKVVFLTIGPLGALRPMLALATGMHKAGHEVVLGSHENYRAIAEEQGVTFLPIAPDSSRLASKQSRDSQFSTAGNPIKYFKALRVEASELSKAAVKVFDRSLELCRGCDVIVFHAHMYVASAIAEHLGIMGIQAYNTPVTPTSRFPSYIRFRHSKRTSSFTNRLSFLMRDIVTWLPYRSTINKWRRDRLACPPLGVMGPYRDMDARQCPLLYSISPSMLPCPDDWPDWVHMTGYWHLPESEEYFPPEDLVRFLDAGEQPVCVGFGSMSYGEAETTTRIVVDAVQQIGCRAILLSGWQGMENTGLPDSIYMCESVSHEWLFQHVAASVNAGGIGTLTTALQAGLPSVVVPFGGDNLFWGWQLERMGVSPGPIHVKSLNASLLAERIKEAMEDPQYKEASEKVSESMKSENGVLAAVELIEKYATQSEI